MFKSHTKDDATKSAHDVGVDLQNAANEAGRKVRSILHSTSDEISQAGEHVTAEIRSNPVRSSIIALGIGVLLGALMRR